MSGTRTKTRRPGMAPRTVSRPHERTEREADKAADLVARGGSVTGWSFSSVAATAPVARQDDGKGTPDEEKKKPPEDENKNAPEAARAALDTPAGEKVQKSILDLPEVKKAIEFAKTPTGIGLGVGLGAAGVTALAASHKPLPFQPPAIPLDKIGLPGVAAKVTLDGPVDRPTGVGLTLTYTEPGPKKNKGPTESEKVRAETARLRAEQDRFRAGLKYVPGSAAARQQAADDKATQEAVARFVASRSSLPGVGRPLIPVSGTTPGTTTAPAQAEEKKPEDTPVQREPATTSDAGAHLDTSRVDDALRGGGRPLDPATRRAMEARFGYDFGHVRLHDDAAANAAASDVSASAFTVGSDIVVAGGALDTRTPPGRRLLAHELAHVVQQAGVRGPVLHRRSALETIGIWLGLIEGTFSDRELTAYLTAITSAGRIDGAYDADNKARAIVRKWKRGEAGWDLRADQKALLIAEMIDGPTLDDDEQAILDLLELSDAGDLRAMFGSGYFTLDDLESDINWAEHDRLEAFLNTRFDGGRGAVAAGRIVVVGPPVPRNAPVFGFDAATLDAEISSDRNTEELIAYIDHLRPIDRPTALHHISQVRRPAMERVLQQYANEVHQATTDADRLAARAMFDEQQRYMLKIERVLHHYYLGQVPATAQDLRTGTAAVAPGQATVLQRAARPQQSGASPFTENAAYESRLRALVPQVVDAYYSHMVTARPAGRYTPDELDQIAAASKAEVDRIFARFYPAAPNGRDPHPLVADRPGQRETLHDAYAEQSATIAAMDANQQRGLAEDKLRYLLSADERISALNRELFASPALNPDGTPANDEARIQNSVVDDFVQDPTNVAHLLELTRVWPGFARPSTGDIFVQVDHPTADRDAQRHRWEMFVMLIHEYLHIIRHPNYTTYARSFGARSPGYSTLAEGVDSLLTETVWEGVLPRLGDMTLRERVEGVQFAHSLPPVGRNLTEFAVEHRYESYTQALRIVDLVGFPNLLAAYLLGLVDRIGGAMPAAPSGSAASAGGTP